MPKSGSLFAQSIEILAHRLHAPCAFAWTDHLNISFRQTQPGGSFVQIRKSETINVSDFNK